MKQQRPQQKQPMKVKKCRRGRKKRKSLRPQDKSFHTEGVDLSDIGSPLLEEGLRRCPSMCTSLSLNGAISPEKIS
ncbi:hypothetical protein E3N88_04590 [Mikania micrantha]|uniref:Uncharacterized protein n=1 Tax=Mikania micrantha TaxID=192012 RepID=A0A5N6PVD2_9ASTR|nr:hypothetical protein E3N88_04590 [Mikania micrantha]